MEVLQETIDILSVITMNQYYDIYKLQFSKGTSRYEMMDTIVWVFHQHQVEQQW